MTLPSLIVLLLLLLLQINGSIPPRNTDIIRTLDLVLPDTRLDPLPQPSRLIIAPRNTDTIRTLDLVLPDTRLDPLPQPSRLIIAPRNTDIIRTLELPVTRLVPLPQPSRLIVVENDPPSSLLFDLLPLLIFLPLIGILLRNPACSVCPVPTAAAPCPAGVVCNPVIDCPVGMERIVIPGVDPPKSCYAFRQGSVTPVQASQACRNIGAYLADFESVVEFNAVTARAAANVPYLIGYTTAFNEAVHLAVASLRTGEAIALPSGVAAAEGVAGQCVFATVTRSAANVRTMGTTNCLDIKNTGYICEADTSTAFAMCP